MMKVILFLLSCTYLTDSRNLWEPKLPELSYSEIAEKGSDFDRIQIPNLRGTLKSNSLSILQNVTELRIIKTRINQIESGALCSADNLKILELDLSNNRNAPKLTQNMFDNCHLDELFLKFDYNNPSEMDENALSKLSGLKKLGIDCLVIPELKKDFVPESLTSLILSQNSITKINSNAFAHMINLESLEITHNVGLSGLPKGVFKNLKVLKQLKLNDNALTNLSWDEFEGLQSLQELVLYDNLISSVDMNKINEHMPVLRILSLEINPINCEILGNQSKSLHLSC